MFSPTIILINLDPALKSKYVQLLILSMKTPYVQRGDSHRDLMTISDWWCSLKLHPVGREVCKFREVFRHQLVRPKGMKLVRANRQLVM